jgi:GNAT superfamily N-acetyltransferase
VGTSASASGAPRTPTRKESNARQDRAWSLPRLDLVDIIYTAKDRFGGLEADPGDLYAQDISVTVTGIVWPEAGDTVEVPLGRGQLSVLDLLEIGEDGLWEVLDRSQEWNGYTALLPELGGPLEDKSSLLILDRLDLVPEARGHGLGLHVLARAMETWARPFGAVALKAAPTTIETRGPKWRRGCEALAAYWSQLGFERLGTTQPPLLYADADLGTVWDSWRHFTSTWQSPGLG